MNAGDLILDVRGLRVGYGGAEVVRGASFGVRRGETLALVGRSGAGKTAAVQSILRLLEPAGKVLGGKILFRGKEGEEIDIGQLRWNSRKLLSLRGGKIGMVFQEPASALSPVHTVGDLVMEAARLHVARDKGEAKKLAAVMLGRVGFSDPEKRMGQYPFEFSGGMRQRAMIAAALVSRPELLIADEPTTALDVTVQGQILELLSELKREMGLSMLFITHDFGVVAKVADEIAVMEAGEIVEAGRVREVMERPVHGVTRELVAAAMGRGLNGVKREVSREVLLKVTELKKVFEVRRRRFFGSEKRAVVAVDGISFEVRRGETLGIVGESGSGKTTAVRCILRAVEPTGGSVQIANGAEMTDVTTVGGKALKMLRREMQMVFQDPFTSLNPRMSVGEIVGEPLVIHGMGTREERRKRVAEMLARVGLEAAWAGRFPNAFSAGQRQRIAIARALILRPKLVVADEAVSSLDAVMQRQILQLLKELQAEMGVAYILVAHDLNVVRAFCDRVVVMRAGKIVEMGAVEEVMERPKEAYTRSLMGAAGLNGQVRLNAAASS